MIVLARLRLNAIATACCLASGVTAIAQLELASVQRISVQVRDEGGNPLRGISRIRLEKEDGTLLEQSNTDSEGRLEFKNAPRTNLVVTVAREGYVSVRERLVGRQSLSEIFISITLVQAASLRSDPHRPLVEASDLLLPAKARREHDKGISRARKGDYQGAATHLEKSAELFPDSPSLWNDLGGVHLRLHNYDLAEAAFRKAINLDTNFARSLLNLGLLDNLRGRYAEAESSLVRFIELEGRRWEGFVELGNAHFGLGQFARAAEDYRRSFELNPPAPPEVHVKLAKVYVATRQFSQALEQYETYLTCDPNGPLAARVREVIERMKADGVVGDKP